jgi:hypothetical protein
MTPNLSAYQAAGDLQLGHERAAQLANDRQLLRTLAATGSLPTDRATLQKHIARPTAVYLPVTRRPKR